MKRLTEDNLDEINRNNRLRGNIIKWWNIIMQSVMRIVHRKPEVGPEKKEDLPEADMSGADMSEAGLYEDILKKNNRTDDVFESAMRDMQEVKEKKADEDKQPDGTNHADEASQIYKRLMEEARMDEEKKRQEIEQARLMAENDQKAKEEEAKQIYERLMEEARMDEEKKKQEIEQARIVAESEENDQKAKEEEAKRIYERLMEEARMDEEKKQQEIEQAKMMAESTENGEGS